MHILILYSGGLDSLIMKRYAEVKFPDAKVTCVYYDIGQEYNHKEMAVLGTHVEVLGLDWLDTKTVSKSKDGSASGSIYIPGRNMVLATAAACKYLPDQIWMGALLGEVHDQATDKNWEFLSRLNDTLNYVLAPFKPEGVEVRFPLASAGMSKLGAVRWAYENGVTQEQMLRSSSCLSGEHGNCGKCVVCFRRWGIFKQLGFEEQYNKHPLQVQANLDIVIEMLFGSHYDSYRQEEIIPACPNWFLELAKSEHEKRKVESSS